MSDIHQEWKEIRQKNGDFINHLDCEMTKLEKKQVELKRRDQLQNLVDAGAFAMQFVTPPPFNCCADDRDILKALNKAQADRIKTLEEELLSLNDQLKAYLEVKKDLDEKLDKAAESYAKLAVERNNLAETISRMEKTIRDLDERNGTLRERLANTNASLIRSIQENSKLRSDAAYIDKMNKAQKKEIERLRTIVNATNGSSSIYTQQGMQSKIAKQANEIKRLTEENEILKHDYKALAEGLSDQTKRVIDLQSARATLKHEIDTLHGALDIAAKDADANFERGKIKGMQEIWKELVDCYDGRTIDENNKIFGYHTVGDMLMNLSPTWFMNKAREYHEQKEKQEQQAKDIQLGDEVEIFDTSCLDDNPHSDIGIVVAVTSDGHSFAAVGPNFEGCFDETDIQRGNVKKTGKHFDSIPLDYFN